MEFGKIDTSLLDRTDLKLPADDPRTWIHLKKSDGSLIRSRDLASRIHIGCPAWGQKAWIGKVYPLGTTPKDFLTHYVTQFTSIELNTTHYRIPDPETIERWRDVAPPGFTYCPKFPQEVSHHRPLAHHTPQVQAFIEGVRGLGPNLGLSFLQLPETFGPRDLEDLKRLLDQIPVDFELAIEFRHHALFRDHQLIAPLFDLMAKTKTHTVITDVAGRRDVLHTSLPTRKVMVRFIGNDLHASDYERIDEWALRLKSWFHLGLEDVQFFIHEPDDIHAPDLVAHFIDRLNAELEIALPKWKPMNQGEQLGFF